MTASDDANVARGLLLHANADEALVLGALAALDRLVARVEQAEREADMYRREAAHARTLASGWAEANAERAGRERAERERDEAREDAVLRGEAARIEARDALARCATLEAALREIENFTFDVMDTDEYQSGRMKEIARAALDAARPADTPGECEHGITFVNRHSGLERCAECLAVLGPADTKEEA